MSDLSEILKEAKNISFNEIPRANIRSFIQYTAENPNESVRSIYERFSNI